ncbi:MAG: restriction endonuclease subunit S, partial [Myxococcales bacterium]|nr:restriction endonuclease subunit S [Myxococcales bacterium]
AMQELLTGKRRLPGFEGEWEMTTLGQLGATYGGLTGKTKADFGSGAARFIPFLNVVTNSIIDREFFEPVRVGIGENQNRAAQGDLFFNGSSETPEEVGLCAVLRNEEPDLYLNSFCFGFRPHPDAGLDGLYLAFFFRGPSGRDLMKSLAQGSTRYNLSKRALLGVEFGLPGSDEQRAISHVLHEMDAEIDALRSKLAKARMIKQGMMHNLLTGKIRLV